jgi:hypothetical protein
MQSNDELCGLAIMQTTNETALESLSYMQVYVDDILYRKSPVMDGRTDAPELV